MECHNGSSLLALDMIQSLGMRNSTARIPDPAQASCEEKRPAGVSGDFPLYLYYRRFMLTGNIALALAVTNASCKITQPPYFPT